MSCGFNIRIINFYGCWNRWYITNGYIQGSWFERNNKKKLSNNLLKNVKWCACLKNVLPQTKIIFTWFCMVFTTTTTTVSTFRIMWKNVSFLIFNFFLHFFLIYFCFIFVLLLLFFKKKFVRPWILCTSHTFLNEICFCFFFLLFL